MSRLSNKFTILSLSILFSLNVDAQVTSMVDPFWGVDFGNVFAGACVPMQLVRVGPDVPAPTPTSGYASDKQILGFSHTHLSGTGGGGRYGNVLLSPVTGTSNPAFRVGLKKDNESAFPGYYSVELKRASGDVNVRLTTNGKAAFHEYTFYTWNKNPQIKGYVFLDPFHTNGRQPEQDIISHTTQVISNQSIQGKAHYKGGWGGDLPYTIYFHIQFNTPFDSVGDWSLNQQSNQLLQGKVFRFLLPQKGKVCVKVGISLLSEQDAANKAASIESWDFLNVRSKADQEWNQWLSKVTLLGGLPEERMLAYTSLYHTLILPTNVSGQNPKWNSSEPHFWDHYCIWDVFRATMPLHTILYPETQRSIIRSLLDIYKQKGWLPDAWIAGDYAPVQGGSNTDVVLADAIIKNLGGFDQTLAFEAMLKNATVESPDPFRMGRYRVKEYEKKGYIPVYPDGKPLNATSRSLEYAYNDYCIGVAAKKIGKTKEAELFLKRSNNAFKLFNQETGFFWAKDPSGKWLPEFSPEKSRKDSWNDPVFMEGNAWNYSMYVPHNMKKLIQLKGGELKTQAFLDTLFSKGHYHIENEPEFYIPYAYHYVGRPDKTAQRIREIVQHQFKAGRRGLPGQDDSGALSAWCFWGLIGMFPIPAQSVYLIGTPHFERMQFALESGKTFEILAKSSSAQKPYVRSASLNGVPLQRAYITHEELMQGGVLELVMSEEPSSSWGRSELPPSLD